MGDSRHRHRRVGLALRLLCFAVAVVALRRELMGLDGRAVLTDLRSYRTLELSAAVGLTAASFLALGALEILALRHVGGNAARAVGRRTAMATAFMSHALSQSTGLAVLTGAAIRVRTYVRDGIGPVAVARVSTLITVIITLALSAVTGFAILLRESAEHSGMLPAVVAVALLLPAAVYLAWSVRAKREAIGRGAWCVPRPSPSMASGQLLCSALDWLTTGMVLFLLLPEGIGLPYSTFLAAYMFAEAVGFASQIPGGIGAFDATLLALLAPPADTGALAASLVMYRVVYYLVPLLGATALLAYSELRGRAHVTHAGALRA